MSGADVLPLKLGLDEAKAAVSEWIPAVKLLVEKWALPAEREEEAIGVVPPSR